MVKSVNTVLGPIDPDQLGVTLAHEHLWINAAPLYQKAHPGLVMSKEKVSKENRDYILQDLQTVVFGYEDNIALQDVDAACKELEIYRQCGGQTLVDVTPVDLYRNPKKLKEIAQKTDIQIIMGGSYYYYPTLENSLKALIMQNDGKNRLADQMIREFYEGADGTDIKPGVIGEVGNGNFEGTETIYRASAITQKETGVPIICHYPDLGVIDIMEQEGADVTKLVMGHWGPGHPMEEAFKRGVMVSVDQLGMNFPGIQSDEERIDTLVDVFEKGYEKQLLLSMDICYKIRWHQHGGEGYAELFRSIFPKLMERGITAEQLRTVMVDNVRRLFA